MANRRRAFTVCGVLAMATATALAQDDYQRFDRFCAETFGASKEPLTYRACGEALTFVDTGLWLHVSETSACVAFQTNLPARTAVEYGPGLPYTERAAGDDRYFYIHVRYLRDLKPDTEYHYRLVATDERGKTVHSADATFRTATPAPVVRVPGDLGKPPFVLDKPKTTYLLTAELTADAAAFEIAADGVTLDLGGHTVVYNNVKQTDPAGNFWAFIRESAVGVRVARRGLKGFRILNGTIRQGAGGNGAEAQLIGYSPILIQGGSGEVAGVTADYYATQLSGIATKWVGACEVHHNVVIDRGSAIKNRHHSTQAIGATASIHHNLIRRARQGGISGPSGSTIFANEVHIDSVCTNSFGIGYYKSRNAECFANRIFGTGYLVIGIGTVSKGVGDIKVHDNFIHLQAVAPDQRWAEYGAQSGAYCTRITWGGENLDYANNVMVTRGRDGGMVRGVWACPEPDITGVVFRDNTVISNFCHVLLGEPYGVGCNAQFINNRFVKVGPDREDYRTIQIGHWNKLCIGHRFIDSTFEGGAGYDAVKFVAEGQREFSVGWTLTVKTAPGATVTIHDAAGKEAFSGIAPADGRLQTPLLAYMHTATGKTMLTPHKLTATKDGRSATATVTMNAPQTVTLPIDPPARP